MSELRCFKDGKYCGCCILEWFTSFNFWAGDSRVYVFRDKRLLYQTEDHSLLNELSHVRELTFDDKNDTSI